MNPPTQDFGHVHVTGLTNRCVYRVSGSARDLSICKLRGFPFAGRSYFLVGGRDTIAGVKG